MIKEKRKKKKKKLTPIEEILRYIKTAGVSLLAASVFTILLSFHARSQMIKNLYSAKENKTKLEQKIAQQIVSHSNLIATLHNKNYPVLMQVGNLYETAGDMPKAEYAYHLATQKAPSGKYISYQKLALALIAQDKLEDAEKLLSEVDDINNLSLIRFKTRANIVLGDRYFSIDKYLKAAEAYESAYYYYSRLTKRDKVVNESIKKRLVNAYVETAGVLVKNGYNSDAARFLKKALKYEPNNLKIQYRLAIVYADLDPIISVKYFEPLIAKIPQDIDYNAFNTVLIKAANIMDLEGNSIKAKYYRYKIHSLDLYLNHKVIYRDDVEVTLDAFLINKALFTYKLKPTFSVKNISSQDINNLYADVILRQNDKVKESVTIHCASKKSPIYSNGGEKGNLSVNFGDKIFTKKELEHYLIDIYLYKEPKYKTLIGSFRIPKKSF